MSYPDPFEFAAQQEAAPGGLVGQLVMNQAVSSMYSRGLIDGNGVYVGSMNPLVAMENAKQLQHENQMSQIMATQQAELWAQMAARSFDAAGREVTPELMQGLRGVAGNFSSLAVPFAIRSEMGRKFLDVSAGGVSPVVLGHAIATQSRYMRDQYGYQRVTRLYAEPTGQRHDRLPGGTIARLDR